MNNDAELLAKTLANMLYPLAAMMLRNGVTYKEFIYHSKLAFVAVAQRDFGLQGRPTNTSRVSAMTGIVRREVKTIKDTLAAQESAPSNESVAQDKMSRVIRGWHEDSEFIDEAGKPKVIPLEEGTPSFKSLVRRFGGGLPMHTILKELMNADCVALLDNGTLQALKNYYSPLGANPQALLRASTVIHDFAQTLVYNLFVASSADAKKPTRLERRAMTDIRRKDAEEFHDYLKSEASVFIERIAQWLIAHEVSPSDVNDSVRVGFGLYGFERKAGE
jgi:hypothetical protein